jgi:hypothetical protein
VSGARSRGSRRSRTAVRDRRAARRARPRADSRVHDRARGSPRAAARRCSTARCRSRPRRSAPPLGGDLDVPRARRHAQAGLATGIGARLGRAHANDGTEERAALGLHAHDERGHFRLGCRKGHRNQRDHQRCQRAGHRTDRSRIRELGPTELLDAGKPGRRETETRGGWHTGRRECGDTGEAGTRRRGHASLEPGAWSLEPGAWSPEPGACTRSTSQRCSRSENSGRRGARAEPVAGSAPSSARSRSLMFSPPP